MIGMETAIKINNILLRDYNKISDEDFLYATWIKSFRDSGFARGVPTPIYNRSQRARIERLLEGKDTYVLIACSPETPELIYGYAVGETPNIIHYLYVKMDYRNQGIGNQLLLHLWDYGADNPVLYSHKSSDIGIEAKLKEDNKLKNFIYDPYVLERHR